MPTYETVLILRPALSDPEVAEISDKTKQSILGGGGEMISQDNWGRRKLTHMIGKAREGVYVYFKFKAPSGLLTKLNHDFAISDSVIRHMNVIAQDRKMREKKKSKPKAASVAAEQ